MPEPIEFAKLSGSGNDFICIDSRDGRFDSMLSDLKAAGHFARSLCRRGLGVGGDGVIFACRPEDDIEADIAARFLEADGSEAELCGNGAGAFVYWAYQNRWHEGPELRILTPAGIVRGQDGQGPYVRVCIPLPEDVQRDRQIDVKGQRWTYDFAVTGVPHVVTYVDHLECLDVAHWGAAFRHHSRFEPRGANANFVQVLGTGRLAIRTFEFGVECETLACGTGCAAAAILATLRFGWPEKYARGQEPVLLRTRSGDVLRVYLTLAADGAVSDLCLETIVRFAYQGTIHPQLADVATHPPDCP
ncbi:MAG TPA: diaminopimelate epimerase [Phycisphaerae bacterium]|nr:diaminopimelate epimerase [Phycisphaerae bacterium]